MCGVVIPFRDVLVARVPFNGCVQIPVSDGLIESLLWSREFSTECRKAHGTSGRPSVDVRRTLLCTDITTPHYIM